MLLVLLLASSCGSREASELFARVEAVMDEHPDSALAMLDSVASEMDTYSKAQRMRYELLHAKAQNKAYVDFTSDSIMKEVVAYYDAHGTANEQVEAHYLLGCVYRDLKESPMALQCYLDATEKADTLSADCDYGMLMRVWGQIANEFDRQAMPYKELEALEHVRYCARKCNDTLSYIIGVELDRRAYVYAADTSMATARYKEAFQLYTANGFYRQAIQSIPAMIPIYLKKDFPEAEKLIDLYEKEVMSPDGNISNGMEVLTLIKTQYFESINRYDSTEYYYRKLRKYGYDYEVCHGLCNVYANMCNVDSVRKYSALMVKAFDDKYQHLHTQAMFNADGMFNYSRNQRIAAENEKEAYRNRTMLILFILFFMLCGLFFFRWHHRYRKQKKEELAKLMNDMCAAEQQYEKLESEQQYILTNLTHLLDIKNKEMEELKAHRQTLANEYSEIPLAEKVELLQDSDAVALMHKYTKPHNNKFLQPKDSDWHQLTKATKQCLPMLFDLLMKDSKLSELEMRTALLTYLGFTPADMKLLLNISPQHLTNTKRIVNNKLFCVPDAKSLYANMKERLEQVSNNTHDVNR